MAQRRIEIKKILATTQGRAYAVVGVTIFLIVLMFFLAIRPAFLSITNQNTQNDEKREYLEELTDKENTLKALAKQEIELHSQIDLMNEYLPDKRNDEYFAANIAAIADLYGVDVLVINFNKNEVITDAELIQYTQMLSVPFRISVKGNLADLQLFLGHLENFPAPVRVEGMAYSDKEQEIFVEGTGVKAFTLDIDAVYYFWRFGV